MVKAVGAFYFVTLRVIASHVGICLPLLRVRMVLFLIVSGLVCQSLFITRMDFVIMVVINGG